MTTTLIRASLDGAIVVAAIWVAARYLRPLSPSARAALWWCAAAKFIVALFWIAPVAIAVLPPSDVRLRTDVEVVRQPPAASAATDDFRLKAEATSGPIAPTTALLAAWTAGVAVAFLTGLQRWRRTRAVVHRSSDAAIDIQAMAADLAGRLRLRRVPRVRVSNEIETPLVFGLVRPTILVPGGTFGLLSTPQQEMALCHELAHIARGDLWLGCVPALAERLFFFHPFVRLASREYSFWRESACDGAVLAALDAAPQDYGRLLLNLGVAQPRTSLAAAGASWSVSNLKRRIVMLGDRSKVTLGSRLTTAAVLGISAVLIAPVQPVARASATVPHVQETEPPVNEVAARAPAADQRTESRRQDAELNYVMFFGDERTWMSGSGADMERARRHKRGDEHLLWFRSGGREYVVRDRATMQQIERLWHRVGELGAEQGKLGAQQGALGAQQGEFGAKQGVIGAEQGRLGARQGELGHRQGQLAQRDWERMTEAQRKEFEKDRRQIDLEMRELDREMRALDNKMKELDKPMRDLGAEMEVLGKQMERLGRQMEEESRKAEGEMRSLLQQLIANGVAEQVK